MRTPCSSRPAVGVISLSSKRKHRPVNARPAEQRRARATSSRREELESARRRAVAAKGAFAAAGACVFAAAMVLSRHSYAGHPEQPTTALAASPASSTSSVGTSEAGIAAPAQAPPGAETACHERGIASARWAARSSCGGSSGEHAASSGCSRTGLIFSRFVPDSELNRVNARRGGSSRSRRCSPRRSGSRSVRRRRPTAWSIPPWGPRSRPRATRGIRDAPGRPAARLGGASGPVWRSGAWWAGGGREARPQRRRQVDRRRRRAGAVYG